MTDSHSTSESESEEPAHERAKKTSRNEFLHSYESFRDTLRSEQTDAQKGEASKLVLSHLQELQDIYNVVQLERNRDTRVHLKDAEALHASSEFAALNAKNLRFGDVGISINQKDFVKHVKQYMNENDVNGDVYEDDEGDNNGLVDTFNSYNWLKLGALYYSTSRRAIPSDFLYGPLATERRRIAPRQRNIDDTTGMTSSTARQINARDVAADEEQNTSQMVRSVYQTFTQKKGEQAINFFEFFINPASFSQSVENLFFTSFLIRDGRLKLYKDKNGIPIVQRASSQEAETAKTAKDKTHHIATFDKATWKALIERFGITESFLGHRETQEDDFDEGESEEESNDSEEIEDEPVVKPENDA